ncbi:hypothetical protein WJX77_012218 [Trebouxia sp. C0004]
MTQNNYEALQNLKAKVPHEADDVTGVGGDESVSEALSKNVFSSYVCTSVKIGVPHPGHIAEPTSLSAIALPATSYPLWDSIPANVVDSGKLSQLQLEGVLYACTKHQQFLPGGDRAGFFIGDGAGVGKGRQIAGIILDNFARGRRRHIWMSTSSDLHHDAERDLRSLNCYLNIINNCQTLDKETRATGLARDMQEGVLFMTYTTLISQMKGKGRLQQVIEWCGGPSFDGCIVFDECHKAKNFVPGKEAQSTKVASCVLQIQQILPRARVVYCSATGVSEVGNMAYMTRLGLWGSGSAFPDFEAFLDSMKKRGVSFMEMLAMELKAEGNYVARGLSFRQAEFMELQCNLIAQQQAVYDASVDLWQSLRHGLAAALVHTNTTSRELWKPFWSAQQRFFKLLCVSLKVPIVAAEAKAALAAGQAVVIGLQSTGEAAADAMQLEPGQMCGFVSTTRELLSRFVTQHFPVRYEPGPNEPADADRPEVPECIAARDSLLQRISALDLPANFLDELVHQLGGPGAVAEMTGRRGRVVADARGRGIYELRAKPDSTEMDSLNVSETAAFMRGEKFVAIVSDAASTGISLHASAAVVNQRRRVHLTIELPWSADKAIQQLGRSHRSNQVTGPIYKLVATNLGGEKRFAAAVARRLQSLGALTRGDRRAASGIDLSESNFDSPLGRKSLRRMYDCIIQCSPLLPSGVTLAEVLEGSSANDVKDIVASLPDSGTISAAAMIAAVETLHDQLRDCVDLMGIGLGASRADTVAEEGTAITKDQPKDIGDVRRFLNRLLGLPVARQNLLFSYFACTLTAEIRAAKADGRYFEGVSDLSGSNVTEILKPKTLWVDPYNGLKTHQNDIIFDRGMSFAAACQKLEHEKGADDSSGFRRSRRPIFGKTMFLLALQKVGTPGVFSICRPNTGTSFFDMEVDELSAKYQAVSIEEVEEGWKDVYERSLTSCMHGPACQQGPSCQVGRRLTQVTILSGSVVRIWGTLENILERNEGSLSKSDRTMRVVRVELEAGKHLVGVRYPAHLLHLVVATLSSIQTLMPPQQQLKHAGNVTAGSGSSALQEQALKAAAMGAGGALRTEPVSPIDKKSLMKALRPPPTVLNFFKPISGGGVKQAAQKRQVLPVAVHVQKKPKLSPQTTVDLVTVSGRPASVSVEPIQVDLDDHQDKAQCSQQAGSAMPSNSSTAGMNGNHSVDSMIASSVSGTEAETIQRTESDGLKPATAYVRRYKGVPYAPDAGSVGFLTNMGFSQDQAVRALKVTQGNIERAANWLLSGM